MQRVCVCITTANALAGDDFLAPEGEDAYGTSYTVSEVPTELQELLNDDGEYEIPSFLNQTVWRNEQECWVIGQLPAGGTTVTCPQVVTVQLTYTCDGMNQYQAELPIELIDVTPPEISVTLVDSDTPHVSFGNVLRYPAHAEVLPVIDTYAPCGGQTDVWHNGEPYIHGTPISGVGLHYLNIHAVDPSGNSSSHTIVFEIRQRPSLTAAVEIESGQCVVNGQDEMIAFHATLRISGADFDHRDILLSSVHLTLHGEDGALLGGEPISIRDAFAPDSRTLQHDLVAARFADEYLRAHFAADFSDATLAECPSSFTIFGVCHDGEMIELEWGRGFDLGFEEIDVTMDPDPDPWDPGDDDDPDPEPPLPCQALEIFGQAPDSCNDPWTSAGLPCIASGGRASTLATIKVRGNSLSRAVVFGGAGTTCTTLFAGCGWTTGTGALSVIFIGGNCCNCSVTYTGFASVTSTVSVAASSTVNSGTANANGSITLSPPATCPAVISNATASIFNGLGSPPPVTGPLVTVNCVVTQCSPTSMGITARVNVFTRATATVPPPPGMSISSTTNARANVTSTIGDINALITFDECDSDCDPELDPDCPKLDF